MSSAPPSKTAELSSHHFIEGKYKDIYEKQRQILSIRFNSNLTDEEKSQHITTELQNLNRLEHDLMLLQKESYEVLEEDLDLLNIRLVVGFPKYYQIKSFDSEGRLVSTSSSRRSSVDSNAPSTITTAFDGNAAGQELKPPLTRNRSRTLDHPFTKATSIHGMTPKESFRYSENKYEAKQLREEIRELRAELLLLKRKKRLSNSEEGRSIELEHQIKDKEASFLKM
ncbi:hypothetical protein FDP41_013195 [Naegleria fowleri]|uniref:Uncharacterized protein n=1 Tax=Naegleria fowleri TaxID=5763 RepID=A0A6A5C1R8_NAEFO|nr:uncharacterized protein FDP41_013195 [Naegleria fowleri]KAF0980712.1 hypothetical protein FDP41_013195 [Naegleria fowleri]CAG4710629.1 unnamed protein product [Naegleria fowleri]